MARQMRDKQIDHQTPSEQQALQQIVTQSASILHDIKGLQVKANQIQQQQQTQRVQPTQVFQQAQQQSNNNQVNMLVQNVKQVKAPTVQSNNFNFTLQNMFQQPSPEQQVQNFVHMSEQFQNEIGKMNTEYQQFVAANLDQNQIKQMMNQKMQAIQKFGNELQQTLNQIQIP